MEKFAVDESADQETLEKIAAHGCPICGVGIIKHGSVLMCPTHGSEPFEEHGKNHKEDTGAKTLRSR